MDLVVDVNHIELELNWNIDMFGMDSLCFGFDINYNYEINVY